MNDGGAMKTTLQLWLEAILGIARQR